MKSDGLLKPAAIALVIAVVLYAVTYTAIEHRRNRHGPWQVAFTNDVSGSPALLINQPALAITNVQIVFSGAGPAALSTNTFNFAQPQPVPCEVPFGKCIFMDTTSLPGTIVFNMFGHEIQLIPRVLTIDHAERPWRSGEMIPLPPKNPATP